MSVRKIQMTLIQIDNYGLWTLDLGPNREADLQVLQSELYADLQRLFSSKGGLVFYTRFDNMLAVTNDIDINGHVEIQENICHRYPITVSMSIGVDTTPYRAQEKATMALQSHRSANDEKRNIVVASGRTLKNEGLVQIAHIDVNDVTTTLTDKVSAYHALLTMINAYEKLAEIFLKKDALVFFAGGDNFLALSNGLARQDYANVLRYVSKEVHLKLKAGIGIAYNAKEAMKLANKALDQIRHNEVDGSICIISEDC
jgi:GTP cyclohydrolase IIa